MHDDCKKMFTDIKLGRKYRYVVYRLTDDLSKVVVESTAGVGKFCNKNACVIFQKIIGCM